MPIASTLILNCHVRPGPDAVVSVSVNGVVSDFNLSPTINWVPSSSIKSSHELSIDLSFTEIKNYEFEIKISAHGNDVLISGYTMTKGRFLISTQPVWNVPGWQPYDIEGHLGENAEYQGNGSLQIFNGQTVEFIGTIIFVKPAT